LMVLDLMLPGEDGLSICRRLRSQSNPMPIIMVKVISFFIICFTPIPRAG
ncbi:hypothetical protein ISX56_29090, partial [Serratia ureilytica]|nr:hypothetical protein [Serratia ureilytica]